MIGLHLSQYRIDEELGRGGMGIVYRATDTKLNRTVALKVLPAAALASADDRARFFREAQAAAQLSHPNIATVYQIDEAAPVEPGAAPDPGVEKRPFIAMEYIEGDTLEARIGKAPLKLTDAVGIARQVAEALKAAHAKQIVHRDVKSANVMLTPDGVAKVLDFGLAKTQASTLLTRQGSTLGTVAYMSPEQARGQEVDGRSDLYSLGTVLYEMVAGRRPFAGDYEQAVVYGILNEDPEPLTALRTGVPMQLEWIVNKLLAKEARHRYQTAADLIADLETVDLSGSGFTRSRPAVSAVARPRGTTGRIAKTWPLIAVFVGLAGAALGWALRSPEPVARMPVQATVVIEGGSLLSHPTISPDGRYLVFTANGLRLMLYDLTDGSMRVLLETQDIRLSRFSPSGRWLAVEHGTTGYSVIQVATGTVARLSETGNVPAWIDDEWILSVHAGGLRRTSRLTQEEVVIRDPDESDGFVVDQPSALPGGRSALVAYGPRDTGADAAGIVHLDDGSIVKLQDDAYGPRYVDTGHVVYTTGEAMALYTGRLFAQPFDVGSEAFVGPAVPVLSERGFWQVDVSATGHLVTTVGLGSGTAAASFDLHRVDPDTGTLEVIRPALPEMDGGFAVSPDGRWIAVANFTRNLASVGPLNPDEGGLISLTGSTGVGDPWFTGDGYQLYYSGGPLGPQWNVFRQATSGATPAERLDLLDTDYEYLCNIDPTGSVGVVAGTNAGSDWKQGVLGLVDLATGTARILPIGWKEGTEDLSISPDGQWLAYQLNESTRPRIYVAGTDGSGPWLIGEGIASPRWMPDSRTLVVRSEREIFLQPLSMTRGVRPAGTPRSVYTGTVSMSYRVDYSDGTILVADRARASDATTDRVDFILNWGERLRREAPLR